MTGTERGGERDFHFTYFSMRNDCSRDEEERESNDMSSMEERKCRGAEEGSGGGRDGGRSNVYLILM